MSFGHLCEVCGQGQIRPFQFSLDEAVVTCDNVDCESRLETSPWSCIVNRNVLQTPLRYQGRIHQGNRSSSSNSSSGFQSDLRSPILSPAPSLDSVTDREVESLFKKSIVPRPKDTRKRILPCTKESIRDNPNPYASFFELLDELDLDSSKSSIKKERTPLATHIKSEDTAGLDDITLELESWMKEFQSPMPTFKTNIGVEGQETKQGLCGKSEGIPQNGDASLYIPSTGSAFSQVSPKSVCGLSVSSCSPLGNVSVNEKNLENNPSTSFEKPITTAKFDSSSICDFQFLSPAASAVSDDSGYEDSGLRTNSMICPPILEKKTYPMCANSILGDGIEKKDDKSLLLSNTKMLRSHLPKNKDLLTVNSLVPQEMVASIEFDQVEAEESGPLVQESIHVDSVVNTQKSNETVPMDVRQKSCRSCPVDDKSKSEVTNTLNILSESSQLSNTTVLEERDVSAERLVNENTCKERSPPKDLKKKGKPRGRPKKKPLDEEEHHPPKRIKRVREGRPPRAIGKEADTTGNESLRRGLASLLQPPTLHIKKSSHHHYNTSNLRSRLNENLIADPWSVPELYVEELCIEVVVRGSRKDENGSVLGKEDEKVVVFNSKCHLSGESVLQKADEKQARQDSNGEESNTGSNQFFNNGAVDTPSNSNSSDNSLVHKDDDLHLVLSSSSSDCSSSNSIINAPTYSIDASSTGSNSKGSDFNACNSLDISSKLGDDNDKAVSITKQLKNVPVNFKSLKQQLEMCVNDELVNEKLNYPIDTWSRPTDVKVQPSNSMKDVETHGDEPSYMPCAIKVNEETQQVLNSFERELQNSTCLGSDKRKNVVNKTRGTISNYQKEISVSDKCNSDAKASTIIDLEPNLLDCLAKESNKLFHSSSDSITETKANIKQEAKEDCSLLPDIDMNESLLLDVGLSDISLEFQKAETETQSHHSQNIDFMLKNDLESSFTCNPSHTNLQGVRSWMGCQEEQPRKTEKEFWKDGTSSCASLDRMGKSSRRSSSHYFKAILQDVDFEEDFFQCPTTENPSSTLGEHISSSLFFGETAHSLMSPLRDDRDFTCKTEPPTSLPTLSVSSSDNILSQTPVETVLGCSRVPNVNSEPRKLPSELSSTTVAKASSSEFISNECPTSSVSARNVSMYSPNHFVTSIAGSKLVSHISNPSLGVPMIFGSSQNDSLKGKVKGKNVSNDMLPINMCKLEKSSPKNVQTRLDLPQKQEKLESDLGSVDAGMDEVSIEEKQMDVKNAKAKNHVTQQLIPEFKSGNIPTISIDSDDEFHITIPNKSESSRIEDIRLPVPMKVEVDNVEQTFCDVSVPVKVEVDDRKQDIFDVLAPIKVEIDDMKQQLGDFPAPMKLKVDDVKQQVKSTLISEEQCETIPTERKGREQTRTSVKRKIFESEYNSSDSKKLKKCISSKERDVPVTTPLPSMNDDDKCSKNFDGQDTMCGILDNSVVHDSSCYSPRAKGFIEFEENSRFGFPPEKINFYIGSRKTNFKLCEDLKVSCGNNTPEKNLGNFEDITLKANNFLNCDKSSTTFSFNLGSKFGCTKSSPQHSSLSPSKSGDSSDEAHRLDAKSLTFLCYNSSSESSYSSSEEDNNVKDTSVIEEKCGQDSVDQYMSACESETTVASNAEVGASVYDGSAEESESDYDMQPKMFKINSSNRKFTNINISDSKGNVYKFPLPQVEKQIRKEVSKTTEALADAKHFNKITSEIKPSVSSLGVLAPKPVCSKPIPSTPDILMPKQVSQVLNSRLKGNNKCSPVVLQRSDSAKSSGLRMVAISQEQNPMCLPKEKVDQKPNLLENTKLSLQDGSHKSLSSSHQIYQQSVTQNSSAVNNTVVGMSSSLSTKNNGQLYILGSSAASAPNPIIDCNMPSDSKSNVIIPPVLRSSYASCEPQVTHHRVPAQGPSNINPNSSNSAYVEEKIVAVKTETPNGPVMRLLRVNVVSNPQKGSHNPSLRANTASNHPKETLKANTSSNHSKGVANSSLNSNVTSDHLKDSNNSSLNTLNRQENPLKSFTIKEKKTKLSSQEVHRIIQPTFGAVKSNVMSPINNVSHTSFLPAAISEKPNIATFSGSNHSKKSEVDMESEHSENKSLVTRIRMGSDGDFIVRPTPRMMQAISAMKKIEDIKKEEEEEEEDDDNSEVECIELPDGIPICNPMTIPEERLPVKKEIVKKQVQVKKQLQVNKERKLKELKKKRKRRKYRLNRIQDLVKEKVQETVVSNKEKVPEMVVVCIGGKLHIYSRDKDSDFSQ